MYSQFGNIVTHAAPARPTIERIPTGTYIVKSSMELGIFLERTDDFILPEKIYGSAREKGKRFFDTFKSRKRSTGVLLAGEKGSGKTLLATDICVRAIQEEIPVVIVNSPYAGDSFFTFLNNINQDLVIMIDEYEKIYKDDPNALLTILDGVFQKKRMWLMTTNNSRVSEFMLNRPGRIFYKVQYKDLEHDVIDQYVNENLNCEEHKVPTITFLKNSSGMNFDCMKAMVEEMNRYGETAAEVAELLNIPNFQPSNGKSKFQFFIGNKEITPEDEPLIGSNSSHLDILCKDNDEFFSKIFPEYNKEEHFVTDAFYVGLDTITEFNPQTFERKGKISVNLQTSNGKFIRSQELTYVAKPYYSRQEKVNWGAGYGAWY